jgi:PAS domain S-box-containing protein
LEGNFTFANRAFYQKFGFTEEEIIGQPSLPTIVEEDHEKVRLKTEECLKTPGKLVSLKIKKAGKAGRIYITNWEFVAITNAKGEPVEVQCMGQDITQEHNYNQELIASKERLENILATVDDIIWSVDAKNFNTLFINQACESITGYTQWDFYNDNQLWFNIVHPEDQAFLKRKLIHIISSKESEVEYRIIHKNGSIRDIRLKAILSSDSEGNPVSITGTSVDLTTQTKSLRLVKEREKFIDHILSTIPGTVYLHNPKQSSTYFLNLSVLNLLSKEGASSTLPENILSDLCHPDDQEKLHHHYQNIIENSSLKQSYKIVIRVKNNEKNTPVKWLILNEVILRREEDNGTFEILGIATDITELRQKEIEARRTNEKLSLAVQIAQLGTCYFYPEKQYILLDDASKEILGETKEKISITDFIDHVDILHQDKISALIHHHKSTNSKRISFSYTLTDGRTKYFKIVFSLSSQEDDVTVLVGAIFDETEEKEIEKSLKEKNEEIIRTHQQVVEYKLMALQSIMNPHFLFNALNSIQFLIAKRQREEALNYLSLFSELLRNVIDSSISGSLLLSEEIKMLHHYLELEKLRFEDKFDYHIEITDTLRKKLIRIPPLLIQPFVENAILHGIKNKPGKGYLSININQSNSQLICTVEDNGIGREKALKIKESNTIKHTSVGVMLTKERLQLINSKYPVNVEIEDLYNEKGEASGTRVKIYVEINKT